MNPLDLGVVGFIALSALFAFARGFVREALSIVAWVGAALATLYGYNYVYGFFGPLVQNPLLSEVIAVGGTFLVSLIVLTMVTGIVARAVRWSAMSPIDRTLGLIFGLARGLALVSLAYLLLDVYLPKGERPPWMTEAKSTPYLAEGAEVLRTFLPESLKLKSATSAEEAPRHSDPEKEAERARSALAKPAAPDLTPPAAAPGYRPSERRDLNRFINNQ
jgi:membrane protein required for colicin V production